MTVVPAHRSDVVCGRRPQQCRPIEGGALVKPLGVFPAACLASLAATAQLPTSDESTHFLFVAPAGASSDDRRTLGAQLDEIYEVVAERVGASLDRKITVSFAPPNPSPCRSRGATMLPRPGSDELPKIFMFVDESTDSKQIWGGFAHEVGHVLEVVALNRASIASVFLEGFATWAAGPYWLEWHGVTSFESAVASYIAAGTYIPLHQDYVVFDTLSPEAEATLGESCVKRRDIVYTEWGAFIEYLVEEHGRDKLHALFRTPALVSEELGRPIAHPNFPAVYGMALEELEAEWLQAITTAADAR